MASFDDRIKELEEYLSSHPEDRTSRDQVTRGYYYECQQKLRELKQKHKSDDSHKFRKSIAILPDGRIAEEIIKDGEPTFVLYDSESDEWSFKSEIELQNGDKIVPILVNDKLLQSLILPDGIERYSTLEDLRKERLELALEVYDPVKNFSLYKLILDIALTSWITEWQSGKAERFMPIINARGPSETGKKRFLTVMRYLCYRSHYCLNVALVPSLFRALDPWNATLVEDEADIPDSVLYNPKVQFLNSRADGVPIPRFSSESGKSEYFSSFGLSVLATRKGFTDDGLESRCIVFPTEGTEKPEDYPLLPSFDWVNRAMRLQRKLLYFRLSHLYKDSMPSQLLIPGISSFRVRESLLMLEGLKHEDPAIVSELSGIAKELEKRIIIERAESPEGIILNLVYQYHDDSNVIAVRCKDGFYLTRINGHDDKTDQPIEEEVLNLNFISEKTGKALSNREISSFWKGLGQSILQKHRLKGSGERKRGILIVKSPDRLLREFRKYVPDLDESGLQRIKDTYGSGPCGPCGPKQETIDGKGGLFDC